MASHRIDGGLLVVTKPLEVATIEDRISLIWNNRVCDWDREAAFADLKRIENKSGVFHCLYTPWEFWK